MVQRFGGGYPPQIPPSGANSWDIEQRINGSFFQRASAWPVNSAAERPLTDRNISYEVLKNKEFGTRLDSAMTNPEFQKEFLSGNRPQYFSLALQNPYFRDEFVTVLKKHPRLGSSNFIEKLDNTCSVALAFMELDLLYDQYTTSPQNLTELADILIKGSFTLKEMEKFFSGEKVAELNKKYSWGQSSSLTERVSVPELRSFAVNDLLFMSIEKLYQTLAMPIRAPESLYPSLTYTKEDRNPNPILDLNTRRVSPINSDPEHHQATIFHINPLMALEYDTDLMNNLSNALLDARRNRDKVAAFLIERPVWQNALAVYRQNHPAEAALGEKDLTCKILAEPLGSQ